MTVASGLQKTNGAPFGPTQGRRRARLQSRALRPTLPYRSGIDYGKAVGFNPALRGDGSERISNGGIMWRFNFLNVFFVILFCGSGIALAGATVDQQPLGPDGQLFGGSVSPKGEHIAVFAGKGSHYEIVMDGVEGPKIDNLIFNIAGDQYRPGSM